MFKKDTPPDVNSASDEKNAPDVTPGAGPDWLELARSAHTASATWFDASVRTAMEQDIRQFQGKHPAGSKYLSDQYRARSRLFRPKTRAAIRKNEAIAAEAFFSTADVVSVAPQDGDDEIQKACADVHKELLQHRLTTPGQIPWFLLVLGAYQEAQKIGVVASHQCWEFNPAKGIDRPVCELIPVESLKFDPAASWMDPINSSPYVIREVPMYVKDVREMARKKGWAAPNDQELLQASISTVDSIRAQREGNRQDSQQSSPKTITEYTLVNVHQNIIEWDGTDHVYWTLGTIKQLSDPVPLKSEYWHDKRPFVIGMFAIESLVNYPSGLGRMSRDVQQEINDVANLRADNVKFVLNKRYFVKRNKQVDTRSLTRNIPGSATMMDDPEKDVRVVDFNDVTSSAYQEHDRLNNDFDELVGTFSTSSVQANRKLNETVGGMQLLTSSTNQVAGYGLRTFTETWVEPVLYQLMQLEAYYESDELILALAFKKARALQQYGQALTGRNMVYLDEQNRIGSISDDFLLQPVRLKVNVGMGATNPMEQVNQFATAMKMVKEILADGVLERYGLKAVEVVKEVLGKLGHQDGSRFFDQGADPRVTQLMQTIQQLQQALEAKEPPEVVAAKVKKLEEEAQSIQAKRVLTGVQASFAAMQAGAIVASQPTVTPVADQVLMAAGWRPPSPPGVDPNFVPPGQAVPAALPPANTSPQFPANPESAAEGATGGIETSTNSDNLPA